MAAKPGRPTDVQTEAGWLPHFSLRDVLHTGSHSIDFSGSRAEYIHQRVRSLCMVLAVLMLLWIPIDWFAVDRSHFATLALTRLLAAVALTLIALRRRPLHRLRSALLQLALFMAVITLFYAGTRIGIEGKASASIIRGYGFFPFLLIALQAVFPLTLIEGLILSAPILVAVILVNLLVGELLSIGALGDLWLLLLLMSVAYWAQLAQLDMLMRLYRQASRDPLTHLFNRRVLLERLREEWHRSRRYKRQLALLMLDLDRFKRINDRRGHLTGDAVLRSFADTLVEQLRNVDVVGRYGGEEFVAVLPETSVDGAREVAERIRRACRNKPAVSADGHVVAYTVSIGITLFEADDSAESALERADRALYRAKRGGRDQIAITHSGDDDPRTGEFPGVSSRT